MKFNKILLVILLFLVCSCKPKIIVKNLVDKEKYDSVCIELIVAKDSIIGLQRSLKLEEEKYNITVNNLHTCDSTNVVLRDELLIANYKLGRIQSYCDIVKRDNTQLKYLRGWINRVLEN